MRCDPRDPWEELEPVLDISTTVIALRDVSINGVRVNRRDRSHRRWEPTGLLANKDLPIPAHPRAEAIPEFVSVDLTGADIGDSLRMSAVKLPEGVRPAVQDRDFVIATVAAPSAVRAEAAEAAAAAVTGEAAPAAAEEPKA